MEIFKLINVLAIWSSYVCLGLASQQQQPDISIIAVMGIGNASVTYTPGPHVILPNNTAPISLRCQARFPVMWTIESLEGKWVNGTTSQRIVGSFHDPTTYKFSMALKLERDWQLQEEQKLNCVSVAPDGPSGEVSLKADASLGAIVLSLRAHSSSNISRRMSSNSNPNMTLSIERRVPFMGGPYEVVKCRLRAEAWPASILPDLKVGFGVCDQPLMCLTANYKVETDMDRLDPQRMANYDHPLSLDHLDRRAMGVLSQLTYYLPNPTVYTCQINKSSERAHLLVTRDNSFVRLQFQIASKSGTTWTNLADSGQEHATLIYASDVLRLRCQGSPFLYASGALFHLELKNGTETFIRNETGNPQNVEFSMPITDTNLIRISCHFPPWNSTEWATVSLGLDVRASSPPVAASSGARTAHQNVSFFSEQSIELDCDFVGVPSPNFIWNTTSEVYSVNWKWLPEDLSPPSNGNVTVSAHYLKSGGLGPIPAAQFSCFAYNPAGNATRFFNVQATRSFVPAMDNNARQAVVMYTGDRDRSLNCSLLQGSPPPLFKWELDGVDILTLDNSTYEQRNHGDLESELVFKNVGLDDEAEFACIATNFLGSVRKEFSVRIRVLPPRATAGFVGGWLATIALVLLLASVAFVSYRQVKQRKKIRILETVGYSKGEEEGASVASNGAGLGNLLDL